MLKKFSRSFERKRDGKTPVKFRFDVQVVKVTGAFASNAPLRVLWTRGSKVQMTQGAPVTSGAAHFEKGLSQVATLYKDVRHNFDFKEYTFKLQTVGSDNASKKATIAKGTVDLAQFAAVGSSERPVTVPLTTSNPQAAKGLELHLKVSSHLLKGSPMDDGASTVSGLSTVTSSVKSGTVEQDLTGFDGDVYRVRSGEFCRAQSGEIDRVNSEKIPALTVSPSTDLCNSLSHTSERSTDSAIVHEGTNGAVEVVAHMQSRVDELEAELKKQAIMREELQRVMESQKRQAESDMAFLKRELESERVQKSELENQLVKEVEDESGHVDLEEALKSAIAPYEVRYTKLAGEYQEDMQQCNAEIEALQEELLSAKDRMAKLENSLEVSERARDMLNVEKRALEMSLIGSCTEHVNMDKERKELRQELTHVDEVMQELIQTKLQYAELSESQTMTRRELCKLKEKNLMLASKITKMETYMYHKQTSARSTY